MWRHECLWKHGLLKLPEEFHEIVKLTVNISANGDWTLDLLNVRLLCQDFFSLKTNSELVSIGLNGGYTCIDKKQLIYAEIKKTEVPELWERIVSIRSLCLQHEIDRGVHTKGLNYFDPSSQNKKNLFWNWNKSR